MTGARDHQAGIAKWDTTLHDGRMRVYEIQGIRFVRVRFPAGK